MKGDGETKMNERDLLNLIKTNPETGIHKLMKLYGGSIGTICRNFLYDCSENDIEEAIADTFIRFWKKASDFELNEKYSLKSYLYTIARNIARDKRRYLKKADIFSIEELSLDLPADFSTENELVRREHEAILHTCLEQMKEPDKSVFLFRYFYGYKISDIAVLLNLPHKKVENILFRGKEKLRRDLYERGIFHA